MSPFTTFANALPANERREDSFSNRNGATVLQLVATRRHNCHASARRRTFDVNAFNVEAGAEKIIRREHLARFSCSAQGVERAVEGVSDFTIALAISIRRPFHSSHE